MSEYIRVLIVDDSEDDALLITDELREHGYDLYYLRIETPEAMTDALSNQAWDVIIADYTMPNFSGPEALHILKQTGLDIPFIFVSGTAADRTGIDMMRAGAKDFILKNNLSRLPLAVEREIAEAGVRKQRHQAEQALQEAEQHRQEFYRRTIYAATDGKLIICEKEEIDTIAGSAIASWDISDKDSLRIMFSDVKKIAREQGMEEMQIPYLMGCVVESAVNATKHAGAGHASLHRTDCGLLFKVSDNGPGIGALSLPDVALTKGYSTAGTLGMGYKIIIDSARKVYLATGPDGTTVAAEVTMERGQSGRCAIQDKLSRWREE